MTLLQQVGRLMGEAIVRRQEDDLDFMTGFSIRLLDSLVCRCGKMYKSRRWLYRHYYETGHWRVPK